MLTQTKTIDLATAQKELLEKREATLTKAAMVGFNKNKLVEMEDQVALLKADISLREKEVLQESEENKQEAVRIYEEQSRQESEAMNRFAEPTKQTLTKKRR